MLSDEWLSRYELLENFNASVTRTGTGTGTHTGTGTWTTGVTAIALCTSCSRAKKWWLAEKHHRNFSSSGFRFLYRESVFGTKISGDSRSIVRYHMYACHEKPNNLHMRKQWRRSAWQ